MKILFSLYLLLGASLYAMNLESIINKALDTNPSLQAINYRIAASNSNVDASNQFSNPTLSYSQNSIDTNQAMSKKTLSLSQKIFYYGKRDSLEAVARAEKEVITQNLEEAKVFLVEAIKKQAYTIWEFENKFNILSEYEKLTKQNIALYESYTSTAQNQHMGIMSATLTLSDLKIQKKYLASKIIAAYAKLSYLANMKVENLELDLVVMDLPPLEAFLQSLPQNRTIALRDKEIKAKESLLKSKKLENYPDVTLLGSYAYRENFDNYVTLGIGLNLPIYATEDYKEEQSRQLVLASKSLKKDSEIAINSQFTTSYATMKSAYEVYHIVHDEAIPQVEHMFELTSSSIATGADLFKYIDILIKKLKLEKQSIEAIANYNRAKAKIEALSGETQ